jgi:hypothetical protein
MHKRPVLRINDSLIPEHADDVIFQHSSFLVVEETTKAGEKLPVVPSN